MELDDKNTHALAGNLPSGRFWRAKFLAETKLYKLLNAIAKSFTDLDNNLASFRKEFFAETADQLLNEHEVDYALPNDLFKETIDKDIRRLQISLIQNANGLLTIEDFQNFLDNSGFSFVTVNLASYTTEFPLEFPAQFGGNGIDFTVYLTITGGQDITILRDYVQTLVPITVKVVIDDQTP